MRAKVGRDIKFYPTETGAQRIAPPAHRDPRTPETLKRGEKEETGPQKPQKGHGGGPKPTPKINKFNRENVDFWGFKIQFSPPLRAAGPTEGRVGLTAVG